MMSLIFFFGIQFLLTYSQTSFCTTTCVGGDCSLTATTGHEIYSELTIDTSTYDNTILSSFKVEVHVTTYSVWESIWTLFIEHNSLLKYPLVNYSIDLSELEDAYCSWLAPDCEIGLEITFSESDDAYDDYDECADDIADSLSTPWTFSLPLTCELKPQLESDTTSYSMTEYFKYNNAATNAYYRFGFINSNLETDKTGTLAEVTQWCITDLVTTSTSPTNTPTVSPVIDTTTSASPTYVPTESSNAPTEVSSNPTSSPTLEPTNDPSSTSPTHFPTDSIPPTRSPSIQSVSTSSPTLEPSNNPSSISPTKAPSKDSIVTTQSPSISTPTNSYCTTKCGKNDCNLYTLSPYEVKSTVFVNNDTYDNTNLITLSVYFDVILHSVETYFEFGVQHEEKYLIFWNGTMELPFSATFKLTVTDSATITDPVDCIWFGKVNTTTSTVECSLKPLNNLTLTQFFNNTATNGNYTFRLTSSQTAFGDTNDLIGTLNEFCIKDIVASEAFDTSSPTLSPTVEPTYEPTVFSTQTPSQDISEMPSQEPTNIPTIVPSVSTFSPSNEPSFDITTSSPSMAFFSDFISTTAEPKANNSSKSWYKGSNLTYLLIAIGALFVICCFICLCAWCRKGQKNGHQFLPSSFDEDEEDEVELAKKDLEDNPLLI